MKMNKSIFLIIPMALAITGSMNADENNTYSTLKINNHEYAIKEERNKDTCKVIIDKDWQTIEIRSTSIDFKAIDYIHKYHDSKPGVQEHYLGEKFNLDGFEEYLMAQPELKDKIKINKIGLLRKTYNFFTSRYFIVPALILCGLYKLGETA